MRGAGCWSSIVAAPQERVALRLTPEHDWLVACVLPEGHRGSHGSDGAQLHRGRRRWLRWDDYARGAHNLVDELECPSRALDGVPCLYFAGHDGPHRYAAPVGRDFPDPVSAPVPMPQAPAAAVPPVMPAVPVVPAAPIKPVEPVFPVSRPVPVPPWARRAGITDPVAVVPPAAAEEAAPELGALDDYFAAMPTVRKFPRTDILTFPEGSFRTEAPAWPASRGAYVAEHHLGRPVDAEPVVSGPDEFFPAEAIIDPAEAIIDVEAIELEPVDLAPVVPPVVAEPEVVERAGGGRSRHRAPDEVAPVPGPNPEQSGSGMLQIRPGESSVLTTPMVQVVSSGLDPVRMGIPTARQSLPRDGDIASIAAVVEDVAAQMRSDPSVAAGSEVSAALHDIAVSLGRLADALNPH